MKRSLVVRTIPMPSRKEIIELYQQGLTTGQVSSKWQISPAWARRVWKEFSEQGKTKNATTRKRIPKWAPWATAIQELIAKRPDITLDELEAELKTGLSRATLCRALKALRLTRKKRL